MKKRQGSKLEKWEVAIVKAMLLRGFVTQDIQAYFSRPSRSINYGRFQEIKDSKTHKAYKAASEQELEKFLSVWPAVDEKTGLPIKCNELLVKAREAMIAAVHTFNGVGLTFRSELFIVTAIIAWTYLLHAFFRRENVDYRYKKGGVVELTPSGAEKYWELSKCINAKECPLDRGIVNNLKFLIEIRNEIEHRSTDRIDDRLSAKLQACCLNFNETIKNIFGNNYALEGRIPIALQFVTFDGAQRESLIRADLPAHIETAMDNFHQTLTEDEQRDPQFRYRVAFVPIVSGKASKCDLAIEFVKSGSPEAEEVDRVLLKEVERHKYLPTQIVEKIRKDGYTDFNMHDHSLLVRECNAKCTGSIYGIIVGNTWYWYEVWLNNVRKILQDGWVRPNKSAKIE